MAQPLPSKATIRHLAVSVHAQGHFDMVAAQRVIVLEMDIVRVKMAAVLRIFVVVNDQFTIKVIHVPVLTCPRFSRSSTLERSERVDVLRPVDNLIQISSLTL